MVGVWALEVYDIEMSPWGCCVLRLLPLGDVCPPLEDRAIVAAPLGGIILGSGFGLDCAIMKAFSLPSPRIRPASLAILSISRG